MIAACGILFDQEKSFMKNVYFSGQVYRGLPQERIARLLPPHINDIYFLLCIHSPWLAWHAWLPYMYWPEGNIYKMLHCLALQ